MALNSYFANYTHARQQDLIEDLVIEAISIYGISVRYLPRTLVDEDTLWGEDDLSQFNEAAELEVYVKSVDNFEGEGDFISRFGLEVRDEITFTVARKRFDQARTEKLLMEVGSNLLQESANTGSPSRKYLSTPYEGFSFRLEEGNGDAYSITSNRPNEGDLIYFPLNKKFYEIKHVEHESVFYQLGHLNIYDLKCESWEYSSEVVNTGNAEIDAVSSNYDIDVLDHAFTLESNNGVILLESGGYLMQEYSIANNVPTADNDYIQSQADDVLDFTETNPFSESIRF